MAFTSTIYHWLNWLRSGVRFGETKRSWRSYRLPGKDDCDQAILMIGGLSSNAATANRTLAEQLHRGRVLTWSRNLYGHTGRFNDFSRSRLWNWIADGVVALRKLVTRHKKKQIVLVGHSTGGLVAVSLLVLHRLTPGWLLRKTSDVSLRAVLIFPPFRLQRKLDSKLLWIVALLYYLVCPLAFLMLAFTGPWMWPLSLFGYLSHLYLVPKIYVPSGDQRASQAGKKLSSMILSESVLLAMLCIYFVAAPPLIALYANIYQNQFSIILFALFICTLMGPLWMMPRSPVEIAIPPDCQTGLCPKRHVGYRWLPVITVANLVILQFLLKFVVRFCRDPILLIEGGQDKVVVVDESYVRRLGNNIQRCKLPDFPHSALSWEQQSHLASIIVEWLESTSKREAAESSSASGSMAEAIGPPSAH